MDMSDNLLITFLKRPRKHHIILSILVIISVFFFETVSLFYETMLNMKYSGNEYGFQHCTIYNTSEGTIDKLCAENGIEKAIKFERIVIPISEDRDCCIDAVPDDYFSFTEYEISSGSFPKTRDEICCESSFLFELGIPHDEFIGCRIKIDNKIYTVTGTFTVNRLWSTYETNEIHCFTAQPQKINSVAFSSISIQRSQSIMSIYETQCSYCVYNMNLWAISRNTSQIHSFYKPIMILFAVVMTAVFSHFISLILMYHKKNISISCLLGIPIKRLRICLMIYLMRVIFFSVLIGTAICFVFVRLIANLCFYTYRDSITPFIKTEEAHTLFFVSISAILVFLLVSFISVYLGTQKSNLESVQNTRALRIKRREANDRITDRYLAKLHIKACMPSNVLTFVVILFLICTVPTTKLYFGYASQNIEGLEGYDYIADIDNDIALGKNYKEAETFLNTMVDPKIDGCTAVPIFSACCELPVDKSFITSEYSTILSQNSSLQFDINNNFTDTVNVPFVIIGISELEQEKLGIKLNDTDVIAYRKVNDFYNNHIIGLKDNFFTKIKIDDEYSLNIVEIGNIYFGSVLVPSSSTVLVVNIPTYKELFGENDIPSRILYIVDDNAKKELTSCFAGKSYIKFTDIGEKKKTNQEIKVMEIINDFITYITFILVVLNCLVIVYINVKNNKKEYAIMSIIGISKYHISKMLALQLCSVILSSLIISDIISFLYTSNYLADLNEISRIKYNMPYSEIVLCNILILLSCFFALSVLISFFWKTTAIKRIHE